MTSVWAKEALLPQGWARDVLIETAPDGRIARVDTDTPQQGQTVGLLLPAPVNVHSHAFQRAMAGLTEARGEAPGSEARDSFWTWRRLMYRFLDRLTPKHVERIAALVQMEMLEAGCATKAEFHYLHHQPDGQPYDSLAEMSERIAAAAAETGIGLCLLPVHYQYGGCDGRALSQGQIRFGNDLERFQRLHDQAGRAIGALPGDASLGAAPHSLRAVGQDDLRGCAERFPTGPIHMHLAEQIREVEEVESHWGARPAEWVLDNMALDDRWCLIHCTQMTPDETIGLARSGVTAGLCPITESNLGDGIFDGLRWVDHGGALAIGSDSNGRISLTEELRTLEYSQRLRDNARAVFATAERSTGRRLFEAVVEGGARAIQRRTGALAEGYWADLMALDDRSLHLEGRSGDTALDSWIFAGDDRMVTDVWAAGRHMVREGRHIRRAEIMRAYRETMGELRDAL
ncbi:MAG: formimidoylglutamate deiminase [Pseudomonadota bacterium]